jgi:hypothetical protein
MGIIAEGVASVMLVAKTKATKAAIECIEQTPSWKENSEAHNVYWRVLNDGITRYFDQCLEYCEVASCTTLNELYDQYNNGFITKWELMCKFVDYFAQNMNFAINNH